MYTWKAHTGIPGCHENLAGLPGRPDVFFLPFPHPLSHAHALTRKNTASSRDYSSSPFVPCAFKLCACVSGKHSFPVFECLPLTHAHNLNAHGTGKGLILQNDYCNPRCTCAPRVKYCDNVSVMSNVLKSSPHHVHKRLYEKD